MLQCAGCRGLVSEFAARCPACGRSVDDATSAPDAPDDTTGPDGRSDLDDPYLGPPAPEPPLPPPWTVDGGPAPTPGSPRTARRRVAALLLSAAVALMAGLAVAVETTSRGPARPPVLSVLSGRVVAASPSKNILAVDPGSGRSVPYPGIRSGSQFTPVASTPDGIVWLEADGQLATLGPRAITVRTTPAESFLSAGTSPAPAEPFADTGRFVVAQTRITSGTSVASLISLTRRQKVDLGIVDAAGGDQQSLGAFVSVPAAPTQLGPSDYATPFVRVPADAGLVEPYGYATADRDVELRRVGRTPVELATAAQLNQDVGRLPTTAVHLGVYPSPTGDAVAVVVQPVRPFAGDVPMVILTRYGGLLATFGDWTGPMYGTGPVWSPGSHQLAFPTYTTTGPALAIATETGNVDAVTAPGPVTGLGHCVWSPNSLDVVCAAIARNRPVWLYATPAGDRLVPAGAPGEPLAWATSGP